MRHLQLLLQSRYRASSSRLTSWRPSGLEDRFSGGGQRDILRFAAASPAGLEGIEGGELLIGELEVEDIEVLGHAAGLGGLRDD